MKQKFPKKYEPGELSATRRRLGDLSEAEARKYADMLGGEIGVERSGEEEYRKEAAAEEDTLVHDGLRGPRFTSGPERRKRKVPYLQRIKIDFLCASQPFRLKTTGNALAALFRFLFPERDYVHPFFLMNAEDLFFTNIENLVTGVRALLAVAGYTGVMSKAPAYYFAILQCIASWNVEGLHMDIVRVKQNPKRKHVKALRSMVRNIYLPVVKLARIEDDTDILKALRWVYRELMKIGVVGGKQKQITTYYDVAKEELPIVFGRIKRSLYPLILKVFDSDYLSYENLFASSFNYLTVYFMLDDNQLITKQTFPDKHPEERNDVEETFGIDEYDEVPAFILSPRYSSTKLFESGENIIEALFPRCGWKNPEGLTDFYAYFSPIFAFPKGAELISPQGVLMRVITLMLMIQELLHGFREIEFGVVHDSDENTWGVQYELSGIIGNWYRYLEEVIGKRYIPMLYEYCRNLEQDIRFRGSPYGKRLLSELNWIKKHYFLPHLIFHAESGTRPTTEGAVAPLPDTLSDFLQILTAVSEDNSDPDQEVTDSVKNPKQPFFFEVENIVSRRLRTVLERNGLPRENAVLIDTVYLLLRTLSGIVRNPLEEGCETELTVPYRSEGEGNRSPVYTVESRDTVTLLAEEERSAGASESGEA